MKPPRSFHAFNATLLLMAGAMAVSAQPIPLLNVTSSVWRYHTNKFDPAYAPADAWVAPGFDDSTWPSGRGTFGFESTANLYPTFNTYITPPTSGGGVSSYFRTHFSWTNNTTANVTFITTNYVDDGMIVWLNGVEIYSFDMPANRPVAWNVSTLPGGANPAPFTEPSVFPTNVLATGLIQGDNVLAVQLQQSGTASSDNVWGLNLWALTPFPPVLTSDLQPENRTVLANRPLILTASFSGSPTPAVQWYFQPGIVDGGTFAPIPGATNANFLISNMALTNEGLYYASISNAVGSTNTRTAVVQFSENLGQSVPFLGLAISTGHPTLTIRGEVGRIYSIQFATHLSQHNTWADLTWFRVMDTDNVWKDSSARPNGQGFYRTKLDPAPTDANLVFIQPGVFTMGSPSNEVGRSPYLEEGPQTVVAISRGFWMGKYLVTQRDYLSVMGNNPSYYTPNLGFSLDLNRPVELVSWNDATAYCARLTQLEQAAGRIPTNCIYRLPTEAEWEYACRAGTTTRFYFGDDSGYTNLANYAWYGQSAVTPTRPVGQLLPNPWGLYDTHGNVWEWCQDWYGPYPGGITTDPHGPVSGSERVLRGGGFASPGNLCRSAQRQSWPPTGPTSDNGFRVVLDLR
jgi:formylglycine-generating enzyme required for sulfatase activity